MLSVTMDAVVFVLTKVLVPDMVVVVAILFNYMMVFTVLDVLVVVVGCVNCNGGATRSSFTKVLVPDVVVIKPVLFNYMVVFAVFDMLVVVDRVNSSGCKRRRRWGDDGGLA